VRTPQGLVAEPEKCKGCYSMLYTGHGASGEATADAGADGGSYANVCYVLLQNVNEQ
jgi:hypothetical protein